MSLSVDIGQTHAELKNFPVCSYCIYCACSCASQLFIHLIGKCVVSYSMKVISYWMVLLLPTAIMALNSCPKEIEQCSYAADRMEATGEVTESLVYVFSNIFGTTINSSNDMELYESVSVQLGINSTADGFVQFQEAVNEISTASSTECSKPVSERVTLESVTELTMEFSQLLDEGLVTEAREIYGKFLCLNSTLEEPAKRKKRQGDDIDDKKALDDFFNGLDGEEFEVIFGFVVHIDNSQITIVRPTLAFVVDDTGSMSEEIDSVRRLIYSFVRTERHIPLCYIYTTFNDPSE